MTAAKTHHVAALALSLVVTLGLFTGVIGLSSPAHASQMLAQGAAAAPQA